MDHPSPRNAEDCKVELFFTIPQWFDAWFLYDILDMIVVLVLAFILAESTTHSVDEQYECYADNKDPHVHFSSKTAYKVVYNQTNYHPPPAGCRAKSLWLFVRHGTRYAVRKKTIEFAKMGDLKQKILHNHRVLKTGVLCEKDLENLERWRWMDVLTSESNLLTPGGEAEMIEIARRYKRRFPHVFQNNYSDDFYKFRHTDHLKSRNSAIAFARGIFGTAIETHREEEIIPYPHEEDLLVRVYPDCRDEYINITPESDLLGQYMKFKKGPEERKVTERVSKRCGFDEALSYDTVSLMFNLCRYEKSWNLEALSPWCAPFTKEDCKVKEYEDDLAYYYNSGPGMEVNKRFGCPLLRDMALQFQEIVRNDSATYASFYFGHSTTLFNLFSQMGTHKDREHITYKNFARMKDDRVWRTSTIDPFASNFGAVLLKCDYDSPYRIMFYHNEMNFKFEKCKDPYMCDWDEFFRLYADDIASSDCETDYCESMDAMVEKIIDEWLVNLQSMNDENGQPGPAEGGDEDENEDEDEKVVSGKIKDAVDGKESRDQEVRPDPPSRLEEPQRDDERSSGVPESDELLYHELFHSSIFIVFVILLLMVFYRLLRFGRRLAVPIRLF